MEREKQKAVERERQEIMRKRELEARKIAEDEARAVLNPSKSKFVSKHKLFLASYAGTIVNINFNIYLLFFKMLFIFISI